MHLGRNMINIHTILPSGKKKHTQQKNVNVNANTNTNTSAGGNGNTKASNANNNGKRNGDGDGDGKGNCMGASSIKSRHRPGTRRRKALAYLQLKTPQKKGTGKGTCTGVGPSKATTSTTTINDDANTNMNAAVVSSHEHTTNVVSVVKDTTTMTRLFEDTTGTFPLAFPPLDFDFGTDDSDVETSTRTDRKENVPPAAATGTGTGTGFQSPSCTTHTHTHSPYRYASVVSLYSHSSASASASSISSSNTSSYLYASSSPWDAFKNCDKSSEAAGAGAGAFFDIYNDAYDDDGCDNGNDDNGNDDNGNDDHCKKKIEASIVPSSSMIMSSSSLTSLMSDITMEEEIGGNAANNENILSTVRTMREFVSIAVKPRVDQLIGAVTITTAGAGAGTSNSCNGADIDTRSDNDRNVNNNDNDRSDNAVLRRLVALLSHPYEPIRVEVVRILSIITETFDYARVVVQYGAVPAFLRMISSIDANVGDVDGIGIYEYSMVCLRQIAKHAKNAGPDIQSCILAADTLSIMSRSMPDLTTKHQKDAHVHVKNNYIWILHYICTWQPLPELEQLLPILPCLLQLLNVVKNDSQILIRTCRTLKCIVSSDTHIAAVVEVEARNGATIRVESKQKTDSGKVIKVIPLLVSLLGHKNKSVVSSAMSVLVHFVKSDVNRTKVLNNSNFLSHHAEQLLHHSDRSIRQATNKFLYYIALGTSSHAATLVSNSSLMSTILKDMMDRNVGKEWRQRRKIIMVVYAILCRAEKESIHKLCELGAIEAICSLFDDSHVQKDEDYEYLILKVLHCILMILKAGTEYGYAFIIELCGGTYKIAKLQISKHKNIRSEATSIMEEHFRFFHLHTPVSINANSKDGRLGNDNSCGESRPLYTTRDILEVHGKCRAEVILRDAEINNLKDQLKLIQIASLGRSDIFQNDTTVENGEIPREAIYVSAFRIFGEWKMTLVELLGCHVNMNVELAPMTLAFNMSTMLREWHKNMTDKFQK